MPIKPRKRRTKKEGIPAAQVYFYETGSYDQSGFDEEDRYDMFMRFNGTLNDAWPENKDKIVSDWVKKNPCTRPWAWWLWDAPRWDDQFFDCYYHGELPEPRQRLGGVGTPSHEVLSIVPHFSFGIPDSWVTQQEVDYYNRNGHFKGVAIDPDDPPCYESEASYLQRHGLLTAAEIKHLEKHPELIEPDLL